MARSQSSRKSAKPSGELRKVARRTPPKRRRGRPPGLTSKQNQLLLLDQNIAELSGDLQALKRPTDKAHDAIEKVKAPLLVPGRIKAKVERAKTIAKGLDSLARLVSIVPGPIGVGAKALHRALVPLLGERGVPGILDQALATLTRVEQTLKPVVTKLNQVERPIDSARAELANLLVHVGRLTAIATSVRTHYGAVPPDDVQACLGKLNDGLSVVVAPIRAARQGAAEPLAQLATALDQLTAALKPLNDVARDVERALSQLDSKVVRDISNILTKIAEAIKPILDAWEWIIKQTIERLLKLFHIDLSAIDRFFKNLINALNPFKDLQRRIERITKDLAARVAALPAVAGLVRALDTLSNIESTLDRTVEAVMRGACRKLLLPEDALARGRRRRWPAAGKRTKPG